MRMTRPTVPGGFDVVFSGRRLAAPLLLAAVCLAPMQAAVAYMFGPTGFHGEVAGNRVAVTKVDKGSPAHGKLKPGDVIVGVAGERFTGKPRLEMVPAIDAAEASGKLTLMLDGGQTVELKLLRLGAYSDTAPWDCAKTDRIVALLANTMVKNGTYQKGRLNVGFLGLMATGEKKYLDIVRRDLPKQEWYTPNPQHMVELLKGERDMGLITWNLGYQLITLGEYYLITGDKTALPAIRTYAVALARGQDAAGTWGHRLISETRNGRLPGYAHINQPSLSCYVGMLLARECGIDDPVVNEAIGRTHRFVASYINKGALPYGVHGPRTKQFNNNGSSASAAIAMKMLKDDDGAKFFSQQCAASYETMERGHAAHYFNPFWTPLGVNVGGPELTQAFFKRAHWIYTLYRTWDGGSGFDGRDLGEGCNITMQLLAHCMPRRALYITGKKPTQAYWADSATVEQAIRASQIDYKSLDADELIALFDHPAPQVRIPAYWTLRERGTAFIPRLIEMLDSGNKDQRLSVLGFFGWKCPKPLVMAQREKIAAILRDTEDDPEVRAAAAACLGWLGEDGYPYLNDMLRLVVQDKPTDELGLIDGDVAKAISALSQHPFKDGIVTDKELFYEAALELGDNPRQVTRAIGMQLLVGMPVQDFHVVGPQVKHVVLDLDRTYHSYHNPQSAVASGVQVLASLNIEEGMRWAVAIPEFPWGKNSFRLRAFMKSLGYYGPYARPVLDKLHGTKLEKNITGGRFNRFWQQMVEQIEAGEKAGELITFEEAMRAGTE